MLQNTVVIGITFLDYSKIVRDKKKQNYLKYAYQQQSISIFANHKTVWLRAVRERAAQKLYKDLKKKHNTICFAQQCRFRPQNSLDMKHNSNQMLFSKSSAL